MKRIIRFLYSGRTKEEISKKTLDVFSFPQVINICALMMKYSKPIYHTMGERPRYEEFPFGMGEIGFEPKKAFFDRLQFSKEESWITFIDSMDKLARYYNKCDLISFFKSLELFGVCLIEGRELTGDAHIVNGFIEDINNYFEEKNIDYSLALDGDRIKVKRKTLNFAQHSIIESTEKLFNELGFEKVEKEFSKARENWTKGNSEGCLRMCNVALESTMHFMGASGKGTGGLFKDLRKKYDIPEIITNKVNHIQKIVEGIEDLRSKKGETHGGKDYNLPHLEETSELCLNLTGSIIIFLLRIKSKK